MTPRSVRRIAVFTPLPPARSSVANVNALLLPPMAERINTTVFVSDRDHARTTAIEGVEIRPASTFDPRRFDLSVHHLGNNGPNHEHVYEAMCRSPGLVVLHDLRMTEFFGWIESHREDLVDFNPTSTASDGTGSSSLDDSLGSIARIVDRSIGILVNCESNRLTLSRLHPTARLFGSRLPYPRAPRPSNHRSTEIFGWKSTDLVAAVIGGIAPHKRIERAVQIVSALRLAGVDIRLLVAGWVFDNAYLDLLRRLIANEGLVGHVHVLTDLSDSEMDSVYEMADVTVDLRDDATGASSFALMASLAHRRTSIVPELRHFADIDDGLVVRVAPAGAAMIEDCATILTELAEQKAFLGRLIADGDHDGSSTIACIVEDHLKAINECSEADPPPSTAMSRSLARRVLPDVGAVTVLGDLTATTGLMEYGRRLINVLHAAGTDLRHSHIDCLGAAHDFRRDTTSLGSVLPKSRLADTEIWFANINEFPALPEHELRPPGSSRHVIACWFWEIPMVQSPFREQFARVDEIWVGSPYIQRTFQQYTDKPVTVIPVPISALPLPHLSRKDFRLDDDEFVVYFDFDANSHVARKNPFGVIDAFRRAFDAQDRSPDGKRPQLVIKAAHLGFQHHVTLRDRLRSAVRHMDAVLIEDELDRRELDSLIGCSDVYVSMHRAEGLGLGMLEAMYLGKPVVSPAYPNKWVFPARELGASIGVVPRPIDVHDIIQYPEIEPIYPRGVIWSEPKVSEAALLVRRYFDTPGLASRMGNRASRLVRSHYNPVACLQAMSSSLSSRKVPG